MVQVKDSASKDGFTPSFCSVESIEPHSLPALERHEQAGGAQNKYKEPSVREKGGAKTTRNSSGDISNSTARRDQAALPFPNGLYILYTVYKLGSAQSS